MLERKNQNYQPEVLVESIWPIKFKHQYIFFLDSINILMYTAYFKNPINLFKMIYLITFRMIEMTDKTAHFFTIDQFSKELFLVIFCCTLINNKKWVRELRQWTRKWHKVSLEWLFTGELAHWYPWAIIIPLLRGDMHPLNSIMALSWALNLWKTMKYLRLKLIRE